MELSVDYISIELESLRLDTAKAFDLFLHVDAGEEKHVLYLSRDIAFSEEARGNLLSKGVKHLYVPKDQEDAYMGYLYQNLADIMSDTDIPVQKRATILCRAAYSTVKDTFSNPSRESIQSAKDVVRHAVTLVRRTDSISAMQLLDATSRDRSLYVHAVNVMLTGVALTEKLVPNIQQKDLERLGAACLLHDIGKSRLPLDVVQKGERLSTAERKVLRSHPKVGIAVLDNTGHLDTVVQAITAQHHERLDGSGYPNGLKDGKIHRFAHICSIANVFDRLTMAESPHGTLSCFDALKEMKQQAGRRFPHDYFETFVLMFAGRN